MDVSSAALSSAAVTFPQTILLVDATNNLHLYTPVGCWTYTSGDNSSCSTIGGLC